MHPFDHENRQPAWALQFVGRSILNTNQGVSTAALGFERDLGINIHGTLFSKILDYDIFAVNGDGRNATNTNEKLQFGSRLMFNVLGKHNYMVSDIEGSQKPVLTVGVAALHEQRDNSTVIANQKVIRYGSDVGFRYRGASLFGEFLYAKNEDNNNNDSGLLAQAGYFLLPGKLEVAARWARIKQGATLTANRVDPLEKGAALNYYFKKHKAKIQLDYLLLENNLNTLNRDDRVIRTQVSLSF